MAVLLGLTVIHAEANGDNHAPPDEIQPQSIIEFVHGGRAEGMYYLPEQDAIFLLEYYPSLDVWAHLVYHWPEAVGLLSLVMLGLLVRKIQHIRKQRRKTGEPFCRKCKYQLTGVTSPTCPECGALAGPRNIIGKPFALRTRLALLAGVLLLAGVYPALIAADRLLDQPAHVPVEPIFGDEFSLTPDLFQRGLPRYGWLSHKIPLCSRWVYQQLFSRHPPNDDRWSVHQQIVIHRVDLGKGARGSRLLEKHPDTEITFHAIFDNFDNSDERSPHMFLKVDDEYWFLPKSGGKARHLTDIDEIAKIYRIEEVSIYSIGGCDNWVFIDYYKRADLPSRLFLVSLEGRPWIELTDRIPEPAKLTWLPDIASPPKLIALDQFHDPPRHAIIDPINDTVSYPTGIEQAVADAIDTEEHSHSKQTWVRPQYPYAHRDPQDLRDAATIELHRKDGMRSSTWNSWHGTHPAPIVRAEVAYPTKVNGKHQARRTSVDLSVLPAPIDAVWVDTELPALFVVCPEKPGIAMFDLRTGLLVQWFILQQPRVRLSLSGHADAALDVQYTPDRRYIFAQVISGWPNNIHVFTYPQSLDEPNPPASP